MPSPTIAKRFQTVEVLVGNTPMLAIRFRFHGIESVIYAKAEHLNLTGSIKDRMMLYILRRAYEEGSLQSGDPIAEATSGNTGISLAAIGRALGNPVTIFMPDWMSRERVQVIQSLGAQVVPVSHQQGGFLGSIRMAEELAQSRPEVFLPRQFSNQVNVESHRCTTGPEILNQLAKYGLKPDAFVAGVGTGGTIMGAGQCLREHLPNIRIHPLEPVESPTLSTGCKVGNHRIQGISDEFIPSILKLKEVDSVVSVHDGDAILMAQKLAAQLGLAVGISSGANFLGALTIQNELGPRAVVVTIFADDNKKYLSTALFGEEPTRQEYLSPDVELLDYDAFGRVCEVCRQSIGINQTCNQMSETP
jgi:cysteine synthase A